MERFMPDGYYRYPTIFGEQVVFVCEDDLWLVPASGGIARRLTSNRGEVSRPAFSPDGQWLAFVGREEGEYEVYVMPALGGPARRLTYLGGSLCQIAGWTPEQKIVFANNAGHWYLRFTQLYTVDPQGEAPELLPYGLARSISYGPHGSVLLGRNTDDPARWKRYRGGLTGQVWIDETGRGEFRPLIRLEGNQTSPMWLGERIYFISDHEGSGNLYSCLPDGNDLQRHTDHEDFYARNAATDGRSIVYHAGADLYHYAPGEGHSRQISVELHSTQTQRSRRFVDAWRYLDDWSLHPKGHSTAITARGKLFTFANWEGAVVQHGKDPHPSLQDADPGTSVRYRLPQWLSDGKRMIATTDEGGEEAFVIWNADGSDEPVLIKDLDIGRPEALAVNPQKNQIVFSNHRYELMFLDLDSRRLQLIDRGKSDPIAGFDWSPDGEWVVYSVSVSLQVTALKLWQATNGQVYPLTKPVLRDVTPSFDPNGRFIYFLSYRTFDPVSDNLQFDLSFPRGMKPYLITLRKDQPSPFELRPRIAAEEEPPETPDEDKSAAEQAAKAQAEEGAGQDPAAEVEPGPEAEKKSVEKEAKPQLKIDLEGIERRVVAFPVQEGIYRRVAGIYNGKVVYTRFPIEGILDEGGIGDPHTRRGSLMIYNFEDQKEELLANGVADFKVSADGQSLIYRDNSRLRVLKAGEKPQEESGPPSRRNGWLNLERVRVSVIPVAEWRQMFREAWRLQRDHFWTPDMADVDWLGVHDRYLPLVNRVGSRSEFSDLMWEMQGELGTSHAYEFGGDYRPAPHYSQGYLGAEYTYRAEQAAWQITQIYQGDGWETQSDSPLNTPGANIQVGDYLLAINGQKLGLDFSPQSALVNLANQEINLTVRPAAKEQPAGEEQPAGTEFPAAEVRPRNVTVKALEDESSVRYRQWVEDNRQRVHAATQGRAGYLHIPDMGAAGFAEFHRGFLAELECQGLIIDLRFNRGGYVSSLLLEKLARKRIGYDTSRWNQVPVPYPQESVWGPMVALTNEYAGSDGDIFSHGFKVMKLGPLIGKRTWGGVIGIWPRHVLVDGTMTTQPEFSFWFNDVGWGVENYGTDPDIEVDILPQDYARGVDTQLERAIQEVLASLEANPPQAPNFSQRPSRAAPRLPRR
jgi:tricorn protease